MNYRREIDGLRAIAVVPVILFHAGFRAFGGGYVGVDVFFVISGYLITSLILAEKQTGAFSLARFYERRAGRILPALFLVMACCCPFAWLWMMPDDLRDFSQTLVTVSTFSSNILFWIKSGYFDSANELKPLLHTWSLAVEEQYYLFFPLFLLLSWRFWNRFTSYILVGVACASLALAHWESMTQPRAGFYLLPSRAWELLIGVFIGQYMFGRRTTDAAAPNNVAREVAAGAGLLLIIAAVFAFDRKTPFPGFYALVPTTGAGLVILYASRRTFVGRLLGSRILVGLGLISYSAYLWHQPLLAFARIRIGSDLDTALRFTLPCVALALAYVSWKFVETPFRRRNLSRRLLVSFAATGSFAFVALGLYANYKQGFVSRLTTEQQEIYAYRLFDFASLWREGKCFLDPEQTYSDFSPDCQRTESKQDIVLVWGDSHAAALTPGLRKLIPDVVQYTASACPPIIDTEFDSRPHCKDINYFVLSDIGRLQPKQVFLHADWLAYQSPDFSQSLNKTLKAIREIAPDTKITIVGGVPQWWPSLPVVILRSHLRLDREQFMQNPLFDELSRLDAELRSIALANGASFISAISALCGTQGCKVVIYADNRFQLMAWDRTHLTEAGSIFLAGKLLERSPSSD